MRYPEKPTYNYFVKKDGKEVNVKDLSPEEQDFAAKWVYSTLVKVLGGKTRRESAKE